MQEYRTVDSDTQNGIYNTEHFGAYLMAIGAIVLMVLGILSGFGIIEITEATDELGLNIGAENSTAASVLGDNFWDGLLFLFGSIAIGFIALCLHMNDHHRMRDPRTLSEGEKGLWSAEHGMAYLGALATLAFVVVGLLVGFDVFDNGNDQRDGLIWITAGITSGILTTTLHLVRHHQTAAETDYIIAVLEERAVGRTGTVSRPMTDPGPQRMG
jgi:hypothetical protein